MPVDPPTTENEVSISIVLTEQDIKQSYLSDTGQKFRQK